ncbi:MAG TPA: DUF2892 domain-containing protein [Cellvibrio sp.]|nr:DUF2892 domain-containing protein [Cellvibrio sp.]
MQLPATNQRVTQNTPEHINLDIQQKIQHSIEYHKSHPNLIAARLKELDREWDVERILETNASSLIVTGSLLGLTLNKKFLAIPLIVGGFLLQHALQGWCPPLPILRRLGYRTASEIEKERNALQGIARHKHH